MNANPSAIFTPEQHSRLTKVMIDVLSSKYVDPSNPPSMREIIESYVEGEGEFDKHYKPGAFDYSKPEVMYQEYWHQYVTMALLHNQVMSKQGGSVKTRLKNTLMQACAITLRLNRLS